MEGHNRKPAKTGLSMEPGDSFHTSMLMSVPFSETAHGKWLKGQ